MDIGRVFETGRTFAEDAATEASACVAKCGTRAGAVMVVFDALFSIGVRGCAIMGFPGIRGSVMVAGSGGVNG